MHTSMHTSMHSNTHWEKPNGALTGCKQPNVLEAPAVRRCRTGRGGGDGRRLVARLGFCEEPRSLTPPRPAHAPTSAGALPCPPGGDRRFCAILERPGGSQGRRSRRADASVPLTASRERQPSRARRDGGSCCHPSCPPARAGVQGAGPLIERCFSTHGGETAKRAFQEIGMWVWWVGW